MPVVIVEREFEQPAVFDELQAREESFAWCLEENGVTFTHTYFSRDRRNMVCVYDAPDAESVRTTQRRAAMPVTRLWTARSLMCAVEREAGRPAARRGLVVVARDFPKPMTMDELINLVDRGHWCFDANGVQFVDSYVNRRGDRTLCVFSAPDAESVRHANRTLSLPVAHAWSASFHSPA